ncbi:peptidase S41 [Candidatus Saccharibacteria bacterium CG_4_10_14_0_2_um_filter_52_9]|nr:MAG: peptidase S41 [Candidatus Saccharibacteria bacterium CG_4_10_14_0_2_um_filter_52_9]
MGLKTKGKGRRWARRTANLLLIAAIFLAGVNVGNGRIDLQRHSSVNGSLPNRLDYTGVDQLYRSIKDNYDGKLSAQQLQDGLKHGLATATKDPYTVYFTPKEAKDFSDQLNNSFSGIGAQLGQDADGNLEVIAPIDDLPAAKAGLKPKDIIASINGTTTSGMSVDEAVSKIRGPKNTQVKLQIVRDHKQSLDFNITRQDINLPSVKSKTLDGNIGYLQITSFSPDTVGLAQKAAEQFKSQNVKGIILDMRNDPGGLLDAAIKVSSLWLPPGQKVLDEKQGNRTTDSSTSVGGNILTGIPTVVLIDGGSASASEIMAGALHDNNQAYLIGEKSYGKGVVQQLINFGDGSQLKVTVASWYRPNGQNINHKGVTPDKIVKISDADAKAGTDTQLQAAQAYLAAKQ